MAQALAQALAQLDDILSNFHAYEEVRSWAWLPDARNCSWLAGCLMKVDIVLPARAAILKNWNFKMCCRFLMRLNQLKSQQSSKHTQVRQPGCSRMITLRQQKRSLQARQRRRRPNKQSSPRNQQFQHPWQTLLPKQGLLSALFGLWKSLTTLISCTGTILPNKVLSYLIRSIVMCLFESYTFEDFGEIMMSVLSMSFLAYKAPAQVILYFSALTRYRYIETFRFMSWNTRCRCQVQVGAGEDDLIQVCLLCLGSRLADCLSWSADSAFQSMQHQVTDNHKSISTCQWPKITWASGTLSQGWPLWWRRLEEGALKICLFILACHSRWLP